MGTGTMNVQDVFLNRLRRSGETSVARLIDGTECKGMLVVFDPTTIVMKVDHTETLIFKQNVISISSSNPAVRVFTESPAWAKNHLYGPEQTGEPPEGGLTLGEKGTYRMPMLERPHQTYHPA